MKNLIVTLSFFLIANVQSQILTDTFQVKKVPISFGITAEGFVLSNTHQYKEPFYHASALAHTVVTIHIGRNVRIPLRISAEVWNFSKSYGDDKNMFTWIKPAIYASFKNIPILDSVNAGAGDLWRVKHGRGLTLDYFEAQGGEISFYKNNFGFSEKLTGMGLTGYDDLFLYSLNYKNNLAINYFINMSEPSSLIRNIRIISADAGVKIGNNLEIYSEAGINIDTYNKAGLLGVNYLLAGSRNKLSANIQFRHYDQSFYTEYNVNNVPIFIYEFLPPLRFQYFSSLTALDKPVNNYYIYLIRHEDHNVLSARIKGIFYPYRDFFLECDLEPMVGTINLFAYDVSVGVEAVEGVYFRSGLLNKFFRLSERSGMTNSEMFDVSNKLWLYLKANFKL